MALSDLLAHPGLGHNLGRGLGQRTTVMTHGGLCSKLPLLIIGPSSLDQLLGLQVVCPSVISANSIPGRSSDLQIKNTVALAPQVFGLASLYLTSRKTIV